METPRSAGTAAARRVVVVVLATTALWALVSGLFQPFLPLYIASLGGSATDVGLAGAVSGLAYLLAEGVWGLIFDRVGAARPLAISKFVTAAVFVGYLARTDLWWIYLLQFLRGVSEVAMAPIGRALLAKHVPREGRGTVMGMYFSTQTLARSGTGVIGGGLVDSLGFRALFAICAVSSLASGLLAFFGLRHTVDAVLVDAPRSAPGRRRAGLGREFVLLSILAGFGFWAQSGWTTFLPLYSAAILHLSASQIGLLSTITGVVVLLLTVPGGRLADRVGRKRLLIAGLAITSLPAIVVASGFGRSFFALALLSVVMATGNAIGNPARQALIADIAPSGRQGLAMGIYGVAEDVGLLIGPLLGGLLWDRAGPPIAFASFALVYWVTIALIISLLREQPQTS
ncbi:MAG: MFS transporter [Chloroflexi bacterium]|nr:MFS transporter [Chloroflexota bacterium]